MTNEQMRREFEAHWRTIQPPSKANRELNQRDGDEYAHGHVARHWMTWQAATLKANQWRPIADAPRDGAKLLGMVHFAGDDLCKPFTEYSLVHWDKGFKSSICDRKPQWEKQFRGDVTHWMPLPLPPTGTEKDKL